MPIVKKTVLHVGDPLTQLSDTERVEVHFHDFLDLKAGSRDMTQSPSFDCHGHSWRLELFPGGDESSHPSYASLYLRPTITMTNYDKDDVPPHPHYYHHPLHPHPHPPKAKISAQVLMPNDGPHFRMGTLDRVSFVGGRKQGWSDFAQVGFLKNKMLQHGTLTVVVDIQIYQRQESLFRLQDSFLHDVKRMIQLPTVGGGGSSSSSSSSSQHVHFVVGSKTFTAHWGLLQVRAPAMAKLVERRGDSDHDNNEVRIENVPVDIFQALLDFVQGEHHYYSHGDEEDSSSSSSTTSSSQHTSTTSSVLASHPTAMLKAADRFGLWQMKVLAELELVHSLTVSNAVEYLLLADAHSCALLKERAMIKVASDSSTIRKSWPDKWQLLSDSHILWKDFLEATDPVEDLPVETIYTLLQEQGLPLDGTREMLLRRLEENNATPKKNSKSNEDEELQEEEEEEENEEEEEEE